MTESVPSDDLPAYPPTRPRGDWWTRGVVAILFVAVLLDFAGRLSSHASTQHQIRNLVCGVVSLEPPLPPHTRVDPITAYLVKTYDCTTFVIPASKALSASVPFRGPDVPAQSR